MLIASSLLRRTSSCVRHASSKSASSSRYLARQKRDPFVRSRDNEQYVSRSAYKLIEIDDKYRFLSRSTQRSGQSKEGGKRGGSRVVDLGASPGGWTQVVLERIYKGGHVFAADLLDLDNRVVNSSLIGESKQLTVFKGDFTDLSFQQSIQAALDERSSPQEADGDADAKVDVILCDMMVNTSGNWIRDGEALLRLHECVFAFAIKSLAKKGWLVMKSFDLQDTQAFRKSILESHFEKVWSIKTAASRKESAEMYWICHHVK